jgi:hypothetical protein
MKPVIALLALLLLAGCGAEHGGSVANSLPTVPADIQLCFRKSLPGIDRALNIGEVEALWKQDRVRYVVMRRCGQRLLAWYEDLRTNWK